MNLLFLIQIFEEYLQSASQQTEYSSVLSSRIVFFDVYCCEYSVLIVPTSKGCGNDRLISRGIFQAHQQVF